MNAGFIKREKGVQQIFLADQVAQFRKKNWSAINFLTSCLEVLYVHYMYITQLVCTVPYSTKCDTVPLYI